MEVLTVVLAVHEDHPKNYSLMNPPTDKDVWKAIYNAVPSNMEYLKHFVTEGWEAYDDGRTYTPEFSSIQIPTGVLMYCLAIYVQNKWDNKISQDMGDRLD